MPGSKRVDRGSPPTRSALAPQCPCVRRPRIDRRGALNGGGNRNSWRDVFRVLRQRTIHQIVILFETSRPPVVHRHQCRGLTAI
jgi:hypothetical protein